MGRVHEQIEVTTHRTGFVADITIQSWAQTFQLDQRGTDA